MRSSVIALALLAASASSTGCGVAEYEVVRVAGGRTHVGRFVSSAAYEASMEAAIAEAKGDWPAAVAAWTRARDEDPDGPELQARLGVALCHTGKLQAGEFAINDALRIDPDLEVGFTGRARCRLLAKAPSYDAIRDDLVRALEADGDAIEPALLFVEVELRQGRLKPARTRAEEAVVMHPQSAAAWRALAEVAARQGDGHRALVAVERTLALDEAMGKKAKLEAVAAIDRAGVASDSLSLRGTALSRPREPAPEKGPCAERFRAFTAIAAHAEPAAITAAAEGTRAACPDLEAEITRVECLSIWTPENAAEVEARALAAPSASARRWAARMQLRRKSTAELLAHDALPRAEDRETLALHLAAVALRADGSEALALATVAHDLAPAEPTVARMLAELARKLGRDAGDRWRRGACDLARTEVERAACKA